MNTFIGLIFCWIIACFPSVCLIAQHTPNQDLNNNSELSAPSVVHPQFRKWPVPSDHIEAQNNPPFLLWPVSEGSGITYDIRLSSDPDFPSIAFSREGIPYAIYCPYESLGTGTWYWQYRQSGGDWSDAFIFRVSDSTKNWNPPSLDKLKNSIPDFHPRLLVKKNTDLQTFRARLRHTKDAKSIIHHADQNLVRSFVSEKLNLNASEVQNKSRVKKLKKDASKKLGNTALEVVESLSRAYLITGEERYAVRGMEWAIYVSTWNPEGVSSLNDFGDSRCMLSMAMAYDTFYDRFTEREKNQLLQAIQARASGFYEDWTDLIEAKVLSNHVWQHIFHYFFQTALATYGDIPESAQWIDYLYELFLSRAPALGRDDGAWLNGNSYFRMNMAVLLDVPLTIKDLTGFDFIKHEKWYQNNPYYLWYSLPPNSSSDGFGDNSKGFANPSREYIAYADALGKITGNNYASQYAQAAQKGGNFEVEDDGSLRWIRLKYLSDLPEKEEVELPSLPRARIFPDAGLVYMNSHPYSTPENLMIAMRSSPFGSYGHMLADQNTFNILYGGKPLFYHSGHKISMNDPHRLQWYKHTRSHNGILINGKGQPYSTETYGWISRFLDGQCLSYAKGDARQAYHTSEHGGKVDYGLQKWDRHILLLYPDIVVIYDDLESDQEAEWSWLLHSPGHLLMNNMDDQFLFTLDHVSSHVDVFGSTNIHWKITDKYATPAENWRGGKDSEGSFVDLEDSDWHLTGISDSTRGMRYFAIIQVRADGEFEPVTVDEKGLFHCANWTINAELDARKPAGLEINRRDGKVAFTTREDVRLGEKVYNGKQKNSAKLLEIVDGEYILQESSDSMPDAMKKAQKHLENK